MLLSIYVDIDDARKVKVSDFTKLIDESGIDCSYEVTVSSDKINALSPDEKDQVYRQVKAKYLKEDIVSRSEEIGKELSEEEIDSITDLYVNHGKYDCNISYWDNIDNLINNI